MGLTLPRLEGKPTSSKELEGRPGGGHHRYIRAVQVEAVFMVGKIASTRARKSREYRGNF